MGAGCRRAVGDKWSDFKDGDEKIFQLDGLFQETIKQRKFLVNTLEGQDEEAMETFKKLGLTALTIDKFYSVFRAIDGDNGGEIDMHEFYVFFDLEESPFVDRAFGLFDRDGSGQIDFEEFVTAVWNFCTTPADELIVFAFNLYDLDGSKDLDKAEVKTLVGEILGDSGTTDEEQAEVGGGDIMDMAKVNVDRLMRDLKPSKNGKIDVKAFRKFVEKQPKAMKPAYKLQQTLQIRVLGEAYWRTASRKRDKVLAIAKGQVDGKIATKAGGADVNEFGVEFIKSATKKASGKEDIKEKYDELANDEYEAAKFRIEEAAKLRYKVKMQEQLWASQNEATNGANADPLELLAKLDDPAREGELKDGIKKTLEDELYAIKHMRGKDSTPPKVERNYGIRVPGGFRRRRLLSSTNPIGGLKGMSALRKRAMRLEIEDMVHNEEPQLALRA
eukprot:g13877.t1